MADSTVDRGNNSGPPRVAGIILGAGLGKRMGQLKQLLPLQGIPMLSHVIQSSRAANLDPLILVLGHEAEKIQTALPPHDAQVIINTEYSRGMASSIRAGLLALDYNHLGALFLLGDMPLVDKTIIQTMAKAGAQSPEKIIIPNFKGKQGNPVYFDQCFFPELRKLSGDRGGRTLFAKYPNAVVDLPVDTRSVCLDIDTPLDYELYRGENK